MSIFPMLSTSFMGPLWIIAYITVTVAMMSPKISWNIELSLKHTGGFFVCLFCCFVLFVIWETFSKTWL